MKYIRLNEKREVAEIFPYDPFELIKNEKFLSNCRKLKNNVKVECGWIEQSDGSFVTPETITANEAAFAPVSLETEPEISALTVGTSTLRLRVDGQKLYADAALPRVIADSVNYLYIRFEFSPEWEELKFVIFSNPHNYKIEVKLENDGCYVPSEYIKAPGFGVSVYCVTGDERLITTDIKQIPVRESGYFRDVRPPNPTPPLSAPVYSPAGSRVSQIRAVEGVLEYKRDGEEWHPVAGQIPVTYDELRTYKEASELVPGAQYLLTDYVTKYVIPYTETIRETLLDNDEHERLVLTAVSADAFSPIAASLNYPRDVIYYDFDDNLCEDGETPRTGFMQRRVDTERCVDMPHDWRTMVWARFRATADEWPQLNPVPIESGHLYRQGEILHLAKKDGLPKSIVDPEYFYNYCSVNDFLWVGRESYKGLTFDMSVYAERYTFNAGREHEYVHATKVVDLLPKHISIQGGSPNTAIRPYPSGDWIAEESEGSTSYTPAFKDIGLRGLTNNVWCCDEVWEYSRAYNITAPNGFYNNTFSHACHNSAFPFDTHDNVFEVCTDMEFGACRFGIFGMMTH